MENSFKGTSRHVGNTGVRSVIDELMHFRTQVTRKDELKAVGGWTNTLNQLLAEGLGRVRTTLALVTHDPAPVDEDGDTAVESSLGQGARQAERERQAGDQTATLRELFAQGDPLSTDDIQMPASHEVALPYIFDGSHRDWPQMSDERFRNVFLKQFVTALDITVRDLSNLACASHGNHIPDDQSAMIHARLESAFAILQEKGGDANMPMIADGTDPEDPTGKVDGTIAPGPSDGLAPVSTAG